MKRVVLLIIFVLCCIISVAQAQESFSYQAIVRYGGEILPDQPVSYLFSIIKGELPGIVVYTEKHNVTTNKFGLVNLAIGNGTDKTGDFTTINWGTDIYSLKVEIDPSGGMTYTDMGTIQLLSVPYALFSKTAGSFTETQNLSDVLANGTDAGNKSLLNISQQSIGTATLSSSAVLEIKSTTKGFLPPRLTTLQIIAVTDPAEGLMVYNTDKKTLNIFNGNKWIDMSGSGLFKIGDTLAGGIIFYIDETGQHGLVCAPADQGIVKWGCNGTIISGAHGTGIGTGNQNTISIITDCTTGGIAARICSDLSLNGYTDWFLPSIDELGEMYSNLKLNGLGDFATTEFAAYWSSSEVDGSLAWFQYFYTLNGKNATSKNNNCYVRAVRAF